MRWPFPTILAHRGGGTLAPENTLAAIRTGARLGFRGVEFDVMLAGDGSAVLIHDETVERTTNGRGRVVDMTYAELRRLDAGDGEHIPTLIEAAALCRSLGVWANVEIKPAKGHERATGEAVASLARELWRGAEAPILSSFSQEALRAARAAVPDLPYGLLVEKLEPQWQERMRELGCIALHCDHESLTPELAGAVGAAGYGLLCYTVNEAATARKLIGWGVDCLVTDALRVIGADFHALTLGQDHNQKGAKT